MNDLIEKLPAVQPEHSNKNFEDMIYAMFDCIWDCEINHPIFNDTVGDLMATVIRCYNKIQENRDGKLLHERRLD